MASKAATVRKKPGTRPPPRQAAVDEPGRPPYLLNVNGDLHCENVYTMVPAGAGSITKCPKPPPTVSPRPNNGNTMPANPKTQKTKRDTTPTPISPQWREILVTPTPPFLTPTAPATQFPHPTRTPVHHRDARAVSTRNARPFVTATHTFPPHANVDHHNKRTSFLTQTRTSFITQRRKRLLLTPTRTVVHRNARTRRVFTERTRRSSPQRTAPFFTQRTRRSSPQRTRSS